MKCEASAEGSWYPCSVQCFERLQASCLAAGLLCNASTVAPSTHGDSTSGSVPGSEQAGSGRGRRRSGEGRRQYSGRRSGSSSEMLRRLSAESGRKAGGGGAARRSAEKFVSDSARLDSSSGWAGPVPATAEAWQEPSLTPFLPGLAASWGNSAASAAPAAVSAPTDPSSQMCATAASRLPHEARARLAVSPEAQRRTSLPGDGRPRRSGMRDSAEHCGGNVAE